ncbi:hypothetical protein F4779DRAFT_622567 [Xylariaceae sp. FL0662B]|nr:hypothetical protein F4779DRAFT_622567 [Xylariaceae sp. FL0662B]
MDPHHPWPYVYSDLGAEENMTDHFNVSLAPDLINVTGKGNFYRTSPHLPKGVSVDDGEKASIQVVARGESGDTLLSGYHVPVCGQAAVRRGVPE